MLLYLLSNAPRSLRGVPFVITIITV
jgi:hypothetical protein